jgi:hypothetical protein
MAQMAIRRLLLVRPPREANLAPIYAALFLLVFLSFLGIVVAIWPKDHSPAAYPADSDRAAPASQPFEGSLRSPPDGREPPKRGNWM